MIKGAKFYYFWIIFLKPEISNALMYGYRLAKSVYQQHLGNNLGNKFNEEDLLLELLDIWGMLRGISMNNLKPIRLSM